KCSAIEVLYFSCALMYLLLLLLCLEMSSAILADFYTLRLASEMQSTMSYLVYQYNGTHSQGPGNGAVDMLQRQLQCCGVQNYTDWLKSTAASWHLLAEEARVPKSCCEEKYSHCRGDLGHLEQLFQEGCLKKLDDRLHVVMLYCCWLHGCACLYMCFCLGNNLSLTTDLQMGTAASASFGKCI
uniref:Uncharacterized protein n=1 Tax=Calidris pygmaea TaxID=425635 RepID=A0A8C3PLD5_9CHAR